MEISVHVNGMGRRRRRSWERRDRKWKGVGRDRRDRGRGGWAQLDGDGILGCHACGGIPCWLGSLIAV